jgi:hypothetical protein
MGNINFFTILQIDGIIYSLNLSDSIFHTKFQLLNRNKNLSESLLLMRGSR